MIWCRSREEKKGHVIASKTGIGKRHLSSLDRQIGERLVIGGIAPGFDASAAFDPALAKAEPRFDLGVGYAMRRCVVTKANDFNTAAHARTSSTASEIAA